MSSILKTVLLLSSFILPLTATEFPLKIMDDCSLIFPPNIFIPKERLKINSAAQIEPLVGSGKDEIGGEYNKTIYTFTLANELILDRTVELELTPNTGLKIRASDQPFLSNTHCLLYNSDQTVNFYTFYNSLKWQKEVGHIFKKPRISSLSESDLVSRFKHEVTLTDEQNLAVKIVLMTPKG